MQYIENLLRNCELAKVAKPINTYVLEGLDGFREVDKGIYIIEEIGGDMVATREDFARFRTSTGRKCSRINKNPSSVLYVGSSKTGVRKRLAQHLGDGHMKTYALNLKHWFGARKMKITVHEYDVSSDVLQIIEDATAYELSPAFGKTGSNGR